MGARRSAAGLLILVVAALTGGTLLGSLPPAGDVRSVAAASDVVLTWTSRQPMHTARSSLAVVTATNGKVYAIGGTNPSAPHPIDLCCLATVEEYDPATNTWATKASMPTPRYWLAAAAAPNGKVYAIGGLGPPNAQSAVVEEYDPSTNSWTRKADLPAANYGLGAAAAANGRIYAIGGGRQPRRTHSHILLQG